MTWIVQLTLLLRQITGHILQPKVQQQQRHPHSSHRTLTGRFFLRQLLTLLMLALNSSGATYKGGEKKQTSTTAVLFITLTMVYTWKSCFCNKTLTLIPNSYSQILTFPVKDEGNSASNLLLSPNLQKQNEDHTKIINNPNPCHKLHAPHNTLRVRITTALISGKNSCY